MRSHLAWIIGLFLIVSSGILMPVAAMADDGDQVPLTAPQVERFITAYPLLLQLAVDLSKQYGDRSDEGAGDPVDSLQAYMDIPDAKARIGTILSTAGFADLDQWSRVSDSVMLAYQYLDPANPPPDVAKDKAKAQADIEADKTLTPEKKTEALQALDEQYADLLDSVPLPGNVEAIRPFADRLKPIAGTN